MKNTTNISQTERKRLAADLEEEKNKIVAGKVEGLQARKLQEKKQQIAQSIQQEERNRRVQLDKAFKSQPGLIRLVYGLRSLLVHVSPEELYHESLLGSLRSNILKFSRQPVLANNQMISGKFIDKLYAAYIQASALDNVLKAMFKQQESMELYTRYAFKHLYNDIDMKRNLSELVDLETLQDKVQEGGQNLRDYLIEQRTLLRRYAKNINPIFSSNLIKGLNELYHLFLFISFDYRKFFISLGGTSISLESGRFKDCPMTIGLKAHLEHFYQFVLMLAGIGSDKSINEVTKYILACGSLVSKQEEDQSLENVTKVANKDEDNKMRRYLEFCRNWNKNICHYPFEDLIRLCGSNNFYALPKAEIPSLQIKERIKKFVEQQLLFELESFVNQTRAESNADARENLLIDYEDSTLEYYSQNSVVNTGRFYGIPGFGHTDEINIIYNFLTKYYARNIKRIIIHLIRNVLPKNATLRTSLMNHSMSLDNLEERVRNFNTELSPDRAWGKSMMNIVYRLEKNDTGNLIKQIREQIKEIDSEAEYLIKQAHTDFETLANQFQGIVTTENAKLLEALNVTMPDSPYSLLVGVEHALHAFNSIQALVRSYYD